MIKCRNIIFNRGHTKSTFAQDSRLLQPLIPTSPPLLPLKIRSFWLELPLSPSISIIVKCREKKLIMSTSIFGWTLNVSFKKPQWYLCKVDTIGAWRKCPLYRQSMWKSEVCKIKHEIHYLTIFQVQIYWKDQKTGRLKKMRSFFSFKCLETGFTTLVHLTADHKVHIIYNQWIGSHFCWKCTKKIMDSAEKRTKSCAK